MGLIKGRTLQTKSNQQIQITGSKRNTKSLLGKLAFGLLLVCFYVGGINLLLLSISSADDNGGNLNLNLNLNANRKASASASASASSADPNKIVKKSNHDEKRKDTKESSRKFENPKPKPNPNPKPKQDSKEKPSLNNNDLEHFPDEFETVKPKTKTKPKTKPKTTKEKGKGKTNTNPHTYTCTYGPNNNNNNGNGNGNGSGTNRTTVIVPRGAPSFVIIGVQKSGSTALLTHFRDHPRMLQTKLSFRREAHFFDTRWNSAVINPANAMGMVGANDKSCLALEQYMKLFDTETMMANSQTMAHNNNNNNNNVTKHNNNNNNSNNSNNKLYTFEKTPAYFGHPKIAARMKQTIPWSKAILVLRNPVDRLYSQYKMTIQNQYDMRKYSLEDMVYHEIKAMKAWNMTTAPLMVPININATTTNNKNKSNNKNNKNNNNDDEPVAAERYETPPRVPKDHAVHDPKKWNPKHRAFLKRTDDSPLGKQLVVRRGLYNIQLVWWLRFYTVGEDLLVINYEDLKTDIRSVFERVLEFSGVPIPYNATNGEGPSDAGIDFRQKVRADKHKDHLPLRNETRRYLSEFYEPYTAELEALLGPEWSPERLGWH